jgi:hypothetical protein
MDWRPPCRPRVRLLLPARRSAYPAPACIAAQPGNRCRLLRRCAGRARPGHCRQGHGKSCSICSVPPRFVDLAPAGRILRHLLDEGGYHCSVSHDVSHPPCQQRGCVHAAQSNFAIPPTPNRNSAVARSLVVGHHQTEGASKMESTSIIRHHRHLQPPRGRLVRC